MFQCGLHPDSWRVGSCSLGAVALQTDSAVLVPQHLTTHRHSGLEGAGPRHAQVFVAVHQRHLLPVRCSGHLVQMLLPRLQNFPQVFASSTSVASRRTGSCLSVMEAVRLERSPSHLVSQAEAISNDMSAKMAVSVMVRSISLPACPAASAPHLSMPILGHLQT